MPIFLSFFWRIEAKKNCFWNYLTFSTLLATLCKLHCIVQTVGVGFSLIVSSIAIDVIVMGLRVLYEKSVTVLCHLMIYCRSISTFIQSKKNKFSKILNRFFSKATTDSQLIICRFLDLRKNFCKDNRSNFLLPEYLSANYCQIFARWATAHPMFLEHWNRQKNLSNIGQRFFMFTWFEDSEQIVSYNWFSENSIQILRFEKSTSFWQRQLIKFSPALNIYFCWVLRNLKFAGELTANFFWDGLLVCCSLPLNNFILCSLVIFRSPFVIFVVLYCPQIILSVKKLEYKMALTILNGKCNKTFSRHTNIVQKKCCKKSLEAGFFPDALTLVALWLLVFQWLFFVGLCIW